jgi:hypothetical protein
MLINGALDENKDHLVETHSVYFLVLAKEIIKLSYDKVIGG